MNATDDEDDDQPRLGPCCICETFFGVTNIVMLDRRAPTPGKGWGCVVCGLPSNGAIAVLCDGCTELVEAGANPIPPKPERVRFADLSAEPFAHDMTKHGECAA